MNTNDDIINGLINNDQAVVKRIYKTQFPIISGWIKKNNGTQDDANDMMQEAFLILIRKIKAERLDLVCNFSTYFFSICKHLWFQELRKKIRTSQTKIDDYYDLTDDNSDDEFEERKLNVFLEQINQLETKCRQLLLLYCEKRSLTDIMHIMGFKNTQAVADKKKNCRKRLIENLLNCKEYKDLQGEIFINY
jgi:RNA polymerase sigma factor (sigma-70 family)